MIADSFLNRFGGRGPTVVRSGRAAGSAVVCVLSITALAWHTYSQRPRVWRPGELPVAFWAWQSRAPQQIDVDAAISQTGAGVLFLRAGQIDLENGKPQRIRAVAGTMPKNIKLHLVYNATRDLLSGFEKLNPNEVAEAVTEAYALDERRAVADGASVDGAQLDFDVPTRLLRAYARLLVSVRARLPAEARLSISGLPTWMASPSLKDALSQVDFWIPQCYGASIPERVERSEPIASPTLVAKAVARARELGCPFYAGLAAYGYAIHYSRDGSLLALRGDLDPEVIAGTVELELAGRHTFGGASRESSEATSAEWQHIYRARSDCVIDGISVRTGEWIVFEVSTSASLRECARAAREQGGDSLLGLCIFRLPAVEDRTTLSAQEINSALADIDPATSFKLQARAMPRTRHVLITAENDGSTSSTVGQSAMTLSVKVPSGSVRSVRLAGFKSYESIAGAGGDARPEACSLRRADSLRFTKDCWRPGMRASAEIEFAGEPPGSIQTEFSAPTDAAREFREMRTIQISRSGKQ